MAPIERATLFTVGNEEDGKKILETYKTMKSDAKKVRQCHFTHYLSLHNSFLLPFSLCISQPQLEASPGQHPPSLPPPSHLIHYTSRIPFPTSTPTNTSLFNRTANPTSSPCAPVP